MPLGIRAQNRTDAGGAEPLRRKRVVAGSRRRSSGGAAVHLLLIFVTLVLVVDALIGEKGLMESMQARRQYREVAASLEPLRRENAKLRDEVRRLNEDPATIESVAREQLGLIRPGEVVFILKDQRNSSSRLYWRRAALPRVYAGAVMIKSGPRTAIARRLLVHAAGLLRRCRSCSRPHRTGPADTQPPATPPQGTGQKVAAAEEQTKPTRGFFPTLFHNLGDDIKHIPRKNTLYWLAAGAGGVAGHPSGGRLHQRSAEQFRFGQDVLQGGQVRRIVSGADGHGGYDLPRRAERDRHSAAPHLGMDLIEATLLSDGMTELIKVAVRRERPIRDDGTRAAGLCVPVRARGGHIRRRHGAAAAPRLEVGGADLHDCVVRRDVPTGRRSPLGQRRGRGRGARGSSSAGR